MCPVCLAADNADPTNLRALVRYQVSRPLSRLSGPGDAPKRPRPVVNPGERIDMTERTPRWGTPAERLERKTDRSSPDGCWLWTGQRNSDGYGRLYANGEYTGAHRLAYELRVGPIPKGLVIDHLCRNRACVNPAHMEPVTSRENILRGQGLAALNAKKTHCPQGHEYNAENTSLYDGRRYCRPCRNAPNPKRNRRGRRGKQLG